MLTNLLPWLWSILLGTVSLGGLSSSWWVPQPAALLWTFLALLIIAFAPYRVWEKAQTRVDELEEEQVPRVSLTPRAGRASHGSHPHLMWAELDVTNLSPTLSLPDVEVRITDLKSETQLEYGDRVGYPEWNALQVTWSPTNAVPDQFRLTIPPGETRSALIAYSDDSNGPPAVFASPHAGARLLRSGPNRMEVSVSSPNAARCRGVFYIECHPNYATRLEGGLISLDGPRATMVMEPWDAYAARANDKPSPAAVELSPTPSPKPTAETASPEAQRAP